MNKLWSEHLGEQTYWQHGRFSVVNGTKLIWYGLLGIIHGIWPSAFPFSTARFVVRDFYLLKSTGRHNEYIHKTHEAYIDQMIRSDLKCEPGVDLSGLVSSDNLDVDADLLKRYGAKDWRTYVRLEFDDE